MLPAGARTRDFSPAQNLCVKWVVFDPLGNLHYRQVGPPAATLRAGRLSKWCRCSFGDRKIVAASTSAKPFTGGSVSTSQAVAEHLPLLRRYARALTGSQESGDAYVAAALEALVADRSVLQRASGPRVAIYRLFTQIWNLVGIDAKSPAVAGLPVDRRLRHLTPLPRQAFLLVALESFSEREAAEILDTDAATLRQLVEESGRELAAEIATDVLIIEDEAIIAIDLETLVESLGHRVLGIARTHGEALALARKKTPGLILADIQLADGSSGLDAVNELLKSFEVPVIFI